MTADTITASTLVSNLRQHKGATIATVTIDTDPKARKSCPIAGLRKVSRMNVMLGASYENCCNNQQEREDMERDFVAQARKWGVRKDLKTVEHNGKTYLTLSVLKHLETTYKDSEGNEVPADLVKDHLPKKPEPATQNTDKKIIYRDVLVENIKHINVFGKTFDVR